MFSFVLLCSIDILALIQPKEALYLAIYICHKAPGTSGISVKRANAGEWPSPAKVKFVSKFIEAELKL